MLEPEQNLILGSTRKENDNYYNSLFLLDHKSIKKFDKKILVPFGEFLPLRKIFNFMEFIAGTKDYSIGEDDRLLNLNNKTQIIPAICYEIVYFWRLINESNNNAQIIINITNDSWFGKFSGPYQHFYFTKLRAAEFNKILIRVSNSGISAVINNYGKVVNFIELNKQDTKTIKVKFPKKQNNYIIFHKFIFYIIILSLFVALFFRKKR